MEDVSSQGTRSGEQDRSILKLLDQSRRRLVELGTRNRLIHVNRANARANILNIVNERSDDIFTILYRKHRKMRFQALRSEVDSDEENISDVPKLGAWSGSGEIDESRYTDNKLETFLTPDALQKRLLRLAKDANTAEQEQGINILFLALGFLTWYEDKNSSVKREAPLILLPAQLTRSARTATYEISIRDDDIQANLPLQERLNDSFGIKLPEIDIDDDWSPTSYFDQIEKHITQKANWSIDRDGMQLGFFSFAKLLMYRDLDPASWPSGTLLGHPFTRGLLTGGITSEPPLFDKDTKLDQVLAPADIIQVVPADASQTKVIEEVRADRSLVVQGPPGTGKSQTITNIIASAVHDGKRILFMAEKMAALEVVHKKLVDAGLRDICLELHSRSANKKAILSELERTLRSSAAVPSMPSPPDELKKVRDNLNRTSDILHQPILKSGETPHTVMGIQAKLRGEGAPSPRFFKADLTRINRGLLDQLLTHIEEYGRKVETYNGLCNHPLYGIGNLGLQPTDLDRLQPELDQTVERLALFIRDCGDLISQLEAQVELTFAGCGTLRKLVQKIECAPDCSAKTLEAFLSQDISDRLIETLKTGESFQAAKREAETNFVDHAWVAEVSGLRADIVAAQNSFWSRLGAAYRQAGKHLAAILKSSLPKKADARLALLDQLLLVQKLARDLKEEEDYLSARLGENWRGQRTEFSAMRTGAEWARAVSQICKVTNYANTVSLAKNRADNSHLKNMLGEEASDLSNSCTEIFQHLLFDFDKSDDPRSLQDVPLTEVQEAISRIVSSISETYGEWTKIQQIGEILEKNELGELRTLIDVGEFGAQKAKVELRYARAEALWKAALTPELNQLRTEDRGQDAADFKHLEQERIEDTRREILARHLAQLPSGSAGEMGVIRGEIGKRSRYLPVRQLMTRAASAIQRIKPVFLMSPISIAQFLPPEKFEFDILVIDEASQVRPEDALGAIARCKQIIVVGDQKQMPPSNFFSRLTDNDDSDLDDEEDPLQGAARATEMESILSLAEARSVGGKPRMLTWHYRSKDPSLIRVSNEQFYDGELILPPSPVQNDEKFGLIFTKVNGIYHRGRSGKNINPIEAQAIVDRVAQHARECPDLSLGIATLSKVQQTHINELLEFTRRNDPTLDSFLHEGKVEDLFVKNLENVQGDERDVVLVSICYGPAEPGGRLSSMHFGVNKEGDERRLNVLFTRARVRCEVFCSFEPGDIDPRRTTHKGPVILKYFLDFAKTGIRREERVTGLGPDSPLEEDIAKVIRDLGYEVDYQVGSAGFRLDLAVRDKIHSGQYILAVECDGATYHSALWARERDRLRQAVLEELGWRFHRIWSTDWFYNRGAEIDRLTKALIDAAANALEGFTLIGVNANSGGEFDEFASDDLDEQMLEGPSILDDVPVKRRPLYRTFDVSEKITGSEPHNCQLSFLADLTLRIVEQEGPVHEVEVARRVAEKFGKERTGTRIFGAAKRALSAARLNGETKLLSSDGFWFTPEQFRDPPVRDRSNLTGSLLKAEMLPPMEIQKAAELANEENGHIEGDQLVRAVGSMLGFKRIGPDLKEAFSVAIDEPDRG